MKTDEKHFIIEERLLFTGSIPVGQNERKCEIEATEDGLCVDGYVFIPWDWIRNAASALSPFHLQQNQRES